ncbi:MAG: PHP domain-containing protein, partial [Hyphomicrobiaceae bacterium]|nr:PHP domain-containing protein [Hyphomicrobiaceae bacterium]
MSPPAHAYAELQVTTNFSFLRGGSHPQELVAQAKALGLSALAVTDRNTLAGVVRAHTAAKDSGLRLIVGVRLDLQDAPSLVCLPTSRAAYGRLCRLLTLGQRRAEKGQCTLFLDDVVAHGEGQIFIALAPEGWSWREAAAQPAEGGAPSASVLRFPAPARRTAAHEGEPERAAAALPSTGRAARRSRAGGVE